jgi:hypothetical protein
MRCRLAAGAGITAAMVAPVIKAKTFDYKGAFQWLFDTEQAMAH